MKDYKALIRWMLVDVGALMAEPTHARQNTFYFWRKMCQRYIDNPDDFDGEVEDLLALIAACREVDELTKDMPTIPGWTK